METNDTKPGYLIAEEWYHEEEIFRAIERTRSIRADPSDKIPEDIYSREFAAWLTKQYRLAMAKGIQLGRGW